MYQFNVDVPEVVVFVWHNSNEDYFKDFYLKHLLTNSFDEDLLSFVCNRVNHLINFIDFWVQSLCVHGTRINFDMFYVRHVNFHHTFRDLTCNQVTE